MPLAQGRLATEPDRPAVRRSALSAVSWVGRRTGGALSDSSAFGDERSEGVDPRRRDALPESGMPVPPDLILAAISSELSWSTSRLGPFVPLDPVAASVWQLPQLPCAHAVAAAVLEPVGAGGVFVFAASRMSRASVVPAGGSGSSACRNRGS
jgi:hypothetical protein